MKKVLLWGLAGLLGFLFLLAGVGLWAKKNDPEGYKRRQQELAVKDNLEQKVIEEDSTERTRADVQEADERQAEDDKEQVNDAFLSASVFLKSKMKDPDSYQEIDHKEYVVKPEPGNKVYIEVMIHYRSKNSFGGYVAKRRYFHFDKDQKLIDSFEG